MKPTLVLLVRRNSTYWKELYRLFICRTISPITTPFPRRVDANEACVPLEAPLVMEWIRRVVIDKGVAKAHIPGLRLPIVGVLSDTRFCIP